MKTLHPFERAPARAYLAALVGLAVFAAGSAAGQERRVLLWKIGMADEIGVVEQETIQDLIATEIAGRGYEVMTDRDVVKMLELEEKRLTCGSDVSCMAEIGAALGVPETVSGSLARIGSSYVLTLQRIDSRASRMLGRSAQRCRGSVENVLDLIPGAVEKLFGPAERPPGDPGGAEVEVESGPRYPTNPYKLWGHVSFWTGLGLFGLGGVMSGLAVNAKSDFDDATDSNAMQAAESRMNTFTGLAAGGYALGGALLVTGVVLWILSPGDRRWAEEHGLVVAPGLDADRAGLQVGWTF